MQLCQPDQDGLASAFADASGAAIEREGAERTTKGWLRGLVAGAVGAMPPVLHKMYWGFTDLADDPDCYDTEVGQHGIVLLRRSSLRNRLTRLHNAAVDLVRAIAQSRPAFLRRPRLQCQGRVVRSRAVCMCFWPHGRGRGRLRATEYTSLPPSTPCSTAVRGSWRASVRHISQAPDRLGAPGHVPAGYSATSVA